LRERAPDPDPEIAPDPTRNMAKSNCKKSQVGLQQSFCKEVCDMFLPTIANFSKTAQLFCQKGWIQGLIMPKSIPDQYDPDPDPQQS